MRLNEFTKIIGNKVILVPYEPKHVKKYHRWMQDPELQELTASEPLTLDEEYEMQSSWRNDEDKLTFLIVSQTLFRETQDELESLVGDTNLFLRIDADDDSNARIHVAEAEIMIAEPAARCQGLGWEAMLLMMKYAVAHLTIQKFEAKIREDNAKSTNMFTKMKFVEISRSSVFKELTMECVVTPDWISWLDEQVQLRIKGYK